MKKILLSLMTLCCVVNVSAKRVYLNVTDSNWSGYWNFWVHCWNNTTSQNLRMNYFVHDVFYVDIDDNYTHIIFVPQSFNDNDISDSGQNWKGQTSDLSIGGNNSGVCYWKKDGGWGDRYLGKDFYLKHPWGTGEDKDWKWSARLGANGDGTYSIVAQYGGAGCNWNTVDYEEENSNGTRTGPYLSASPELVVNGSPTKGDYCTFTLNPDYGTQGQITITKLDYSNIYLRGDILHVLDPYGITETESWNTLIPMVKKEGTNVWTRAMTLNRGTYKVKFDAAGITHGKWNEMNWGYAYNDKIAIGTEYGATQQGLNIEFDVANDHTALIFTIDRDNGKFNISECSHQENLHQYMINEPDENGVETITIYLSNKLGWSNPKLVVLEEDGETIYETIDMTQAYHQQDGRDFYWVWQAKMDVNSPYKKIKFTSEDGVTSVATLDDVSAGYYYADEPTEGIYVLTLWDQQPCPTDKQNGKHEYLCTQCNTHFEDSHTFPCPLCSVLMLASDTQDESYENGTYAKVVFERKNGIKAGYNSICLPFSIPVKRLANSDEAAYAAYLSHVDKKESGHYKLVFANTATIEANKPYIFFGTNAQKRHIFGRMEIQRNSPSDWSASEWTMKGNYTPGFSMYGKYGVVNGGTYADIRIGGKNSTLNAFTAYLEAPSESTVPSLVFEDTDGITHVLEYTDEETTKDVYDLSGRKVARTGKPGIYIIGGKKVVR